MTRYEDVAISVCAEWNDWRSTHVRLGNLRDAHWHQPHGAPRPLLHAYVSCTDIGSGDLSHTCDVSSAPHLVRVCLLKGHNVPSAYAEVARRADRTGTARSRPSSLGRVDLPIPATARG
jgi:hypothetical protein